MKRKYVKNVPLKKLAVKIKRESGFSMKNKEIIEEVLQKEYDDRDGIKPMDEMEWANNQGWIEALEFVLDINIKEQKANKERLNEILLTDNERNQIIAKAIKKSQSENESFDDDEDSESCGICTCRVNPT